MEIAPIFDEKESFRGLVRSNECDPIILFSKLGRTPSFFSHVEPTTYFPIHLRVGTLPSQLAAGDMWRIGSGSSVLVVVDAAVDVLVRNCCFCSKLLHLYQQIVR